VLYLWSKEGYQINVGRTWDWGRNNAVLFLEEVVRPQCSGCNIWGNGQYKIFTRKLIDELGIDRYDELVTISNQTLKYTVQDFIDIQEKYKKLLSEI
jgi:hypothetical protein